MCRLWHSHPTTPLRDCASNPWGSWGVAINYAPVDGARQLARNTAHDEHHATPHRVPRTLGLRIRSIMLELRVIESNRVKRLLQLHFSDTKRCQNDFVLWKVSTLPHGSRLVVQRRLRRSFPNVLPTEEDYSHSLSGVRVSPLQSCMGAVQHATFVEIPHAHRMHIDMDVWPQITTPNIFQEDLQKVHEGTMQTSSVPQACERALLGIEEDIHVWVDLKEALVFKPVQNTVAVAVSSVADVTELSVGLNVRLHLKQLTNKRIPEVQ
mmetsp:Transcript_49048/g.91922  ORF Transcript_49048/g.91922 Transcript_49048/m.91922 type:complete len:266 (+) Transcript_49048:247-1044(+)